MDYRSLAASLITRCTGDNRYCSTVWALWAPGSVARRDWGQRPCDAVCRKRQGARRYPPHRAKGELGAARSMGEPQTTAQQQDRHFLPASRRVDRDSGGSSKLANQQQRDPPDSSVPGRASAHQIPNERTGTDRQRPEHYRRLMGITMPIVKTSPIFIGACHAVVMAIA